MKEIKVILTPDEMFQFFYAVKNLKHRAILMTTYGAGLRLSEVGRLPVEDIDSPRMVIHIRQSKGHKDRDVMLSPRLLVILRQYWEIERLKPYLFPGRYRVSLRKQRQNGKPDRVPGTESKRLSGFSVSGEREPGRAASRLSRSAVASGEPGWDD